MAFTAKAYSDDTPNLNQAMNCPDSNGFYQTMKVKVYQLESMKPWDEVQQVDALKKGDNILPFRGKRFPD